MADPLSIAASIAGIISLTDTVFRYAFKYTRSVSGAQDDIRRLSDEINSFSAVLRSLHALACDLQAQGQEFDCALRVEYLSQCQHTFEKVKKRLKKASDDLEGSSKVKRVARQLKWPYSVSETKELLEDISRQKNAISLATSADTMRQLQLLLSQQSDRFDQIDNSLSKTSSKIEISTQILLNSEKKGVLDFFMPPSLNPQRNLDQSIKWRQPTTGTWLLESEELKQWYSTPGSHLWLKGIPGGGKTVLAGAVIQEALDRALTASKDIGVAFFFCDYKNETTHSPVNILGSIAYQIALQKDEAFELLKDHYEELHPKRSLSRPLDADELRATISRMSTQFEHVYIILDGVDECQDKVEGVATAVQDLADCTDNTSIALFSREEDEIEAALDEDFRQITISARTQDIETYIRAEMMLRESDGRLIVKDVSVKEKIEGELVGRAKGMFRWVACQLDYMSELWSDADRLEALDQLPESLHDSYFRILRKINKLPVKTQDMIRLCMRFLAFFPEPLTIEQLCQAISTPVTLGASLGQIVDQSSVARKCSSLIRKTADGQYFEFAHFTVQEFLSDAALVSLPKFASYRISKPDDGPILGLLCLKFVQLKNFEPNPFSSDKTYSLFFYPKAALRWPQLTANGLQSPELLHAAKSLFRPTKNNIFARWLRTFMTRLSLSMLSDKASDSGSYPLVVDFLKSCRPVHVAAALNLPEICSFLIQGGVNTSSSCSLGSPIELSLSSFLSHYDSCVEPEYHNRYVNEFAWLELTLPRPERRNATIACLRAAGARTNSTTEKMFLHSMLVSWKLEDFRSVADLLSNGLIPTEAEIDSFQDYLDRCWNKGRSSALLGSSLEAFNDYLSTSSLLDTKWGLKLGKLIWYTAVAMELPFTMDPSRTNSRISLSFDALKAQVNFSIADDNSHSLTACLDDGRVSVNEVGCWNLWSSESLLYNAIRRGAVNCTGMLLERGSDPYAEANEFPNAVQLSGFLESIELLDVLVQHRVSLLDVDENGFTIWHFAAQTVSRGSREYLDILFSAHFEDAQMGIRMKSALGETPLDVALKIAILPEDECVILELIAHCNDVPLFWESQGHIFPLAFALRSEKVIKLIMQYGLDLEDSGFNCAHPLHDLACGVSVDWVRFLKGLFPEDYMSRSGGRLPVETYVDNCIKGNDAPEEEILNELTFDGLFETVDEEGRDPWTFLCSAASRIGSENARKGWECFQRALTHYFLQGCLKSYEDNNGECGLHPFFSMLFQMHVDNSLPYSIVDSEVLNKEIGLSRYWRPYSELAVRFLRAAMAAFDIDSVRVLIRNSVPLNHPVDNLTILHFACRPTNALRLSSGPRGKDILELIFADQDSVSLNALSKASPNGGLIHDLAHSEWKKSNAHWILQCLVEKGLDIDAVNDAPLYTKRMTPLTWHLELKSLAMAEVLMDMGASLNGMDSSTPHNKRIRTLTPVHSCAVSGNVAWLRRISEASKRTGIPVLWEAPFRWNMESAGENHFDIMTGFQMACFKGHHECVNFFLEETGIDNQFSSPAGKTALHFAASHGDIVIIEQLIRHGFDVMAETLMKLTPLHYAVMQDNRAAVRTLIQFGAENSIDKYGRTPLSIAVLEKNSEITGILEKRFSSQRETYCNDRLVLTLLLQLKTAIQTGDLQRSKTLIYQGCPLDTPIPRTGHISPLPYSLISRQIAIAEWLLQNGASVLGVDPLSTDPIITAARYPHLTTILPTILQRFTDQGGNWEHYAFPLIAHTGRHGSEAGLKAIFTYLRTHTTTSPLSKELRTRPVSGDVAMRYPLHHSVYHSKYGVVRLLLENGAPVDSVDHLGTTPLALARTSKMVDLLIEFGASPAPLLTNCLASNLISLAQSATRALESLTLAFLQQSGLSSMKWLDTSLPVYHDFSDLGLRHGIFQSQCLLKHCHNGCSKIVNYLAGLPFGIGLGPLLQTGIEVCEVKPFPWHLYHPFTFSRISFIQKHYRVVCKHYGLRDVKIWANLQPDQGWSPLCRAASQNCAETMDNCLSLGADIEFEGCPLGSALMIASACGQLEAVKLLVRRNARVCYEGRAGRLSVFKVATSKTVKAWLLVGRFNDQQRIKNTVEHTSKETKSWSGFVQARANLHGYQHVRDEESRFDCAKRLKTYERMMRGRVAPYIDGLIFNRHLDRTLTPFSSDR